MRHVIIVARDRPALYEDFRRNFEFNAAVAVIVDRRQKRPAAAAADRRARDDDKLRTHGFIVVQME